MKIKNWIHTVKVKFINLLLSIKIYINRLIKPWYYFPIKLLTYTLYYTFKITLKTIKSFLRVIIKIITYPFRSVNNFLKTLLTIFLTLYILFSAFIMIDYITKNYGQFNKLFCRYEVSRKLQNSVVRIISGNTEGSGFFIDSHSIVTNFHVIAREPSPKIIFPDGSFTTAVSVIGDKVSDIAIITVNDNHSEKVLSLMDPIVLKESEPLTAVGYPMGTMIYGQPTQLSGDFIAFRYYREFPVEYVHTSINITKGMSGGPLVDRCGDVVGINTLSLGGTSFYISSSTLLALKDILTDADIVKVDLDPSKSPEESVKAFYTYLKIRDMNAGFGLLSSEYLKNTNFDEWTSRFKDILDVDVIKTEKVSPYSNSVNVKFSTKNWINNEIVSHYYEGTWKTEFEDGIYKMREADIKEVYEPSFMWFWEY